MAAGRNADGTFKKGHRKVGGRAKDPRINKRGKVKKGGHAHNWAGYHRPLKSGKRGLGGRSSRSPARVYGEGEGSYISTRGHRAGTKVGRRTAGNGGARYGISAAKWGSMTRREHKAAVAHYKLTHGPKLKVGQSKSFTTHKSKKKGTQYKTTITRIK